MRETDTLCLKEQLLYKRDPPSLPPSLPPSPPLILLGCARLRNVGTGPQGAVGGERGGLVGWDLVAGGEEAVEEDVEVKRNSLSCQTLSILPPPLLPTSLPPSS